MKKILCALLSVVLGITMLFAVGCDNSQVENGSVSVKYYASASDMLPMLKQGNLTIGLLPEPAATQLTKISTDKTWYRLDLQKLYDQETKAYPQAVMLVKESLLNTYPDIVNKMANAFDGNVAWVKENVNLAVQAIGNCIEDGLTPSLTIKNLNADVVDGCKIYWQNALDAKKAVEDYVKDITAIEPASAKEVSEDFFYNGSASGSFAKDTVTVVAPDGAPALAIARFISENENFGTNKIFNYKVVNSSKIGGAVNQGVGDIVIIPVNAASKLYKANANDKYKLVSVVTHGNLYIMSTEKIDSVLELKDKTVGVIGQGLVPDLTFKAVLTKNSMHAIIAD